MIETCPLCLQPHNIGNPCYGVAACDGTRLAGFGHEVICGKRQDCQRYKIAQKAQDHDRQVWVAAPFTVDKRSRSSCELYRK